MIVDDTVQKERAIMDAGGLSPAMASFLMQDAQNIINKEPPWKPSTIDYNFPEVHTTATRGGTFTNLGNPMFYGNPHRSDFK